MEQGRLREAAEACQKMMDLKPDLQAYARAAQLRWLKGDVEGASEAMQLAAHASSPRDAESAAWAHTRLAFFQWQAGAGAEALATCASATEIFKDYPPALLTRGRILLNADNFEEALQDLEKAARLNPLPEYQWTLLEALEQAGRASAAQAVEMELRKSGAVNDPRTYALFLATRGQESDLALRLAQKEMGERQDIYTRDALAWALARVSRLDEAREQSQRALVEGTRDARLLCHAALIVLQADAKADAAKLYPKACDLKHLLLPSERRLLEAAQPKLLAFDATKSAYKSPVQTTSTAR
jgi:hypothetical protein